MVGDGVGRGGRCNMLHTALLSLCLNNLTCLVNLA